MTFPEKRRLPRSPRAIRVVIFFAFCGLTLGLTWAQTFTVLHSFNRTDGAQPYAALVQGLDGSFYGTTSGGGTQNGHGTIFKITASGAFTNLFNFNGQGDGGQPDAGLTLVPDGSLYGVTNVGGLPDRAGTIFKFSDNALTTLHSFDRSIASLPFGGLLLSADGNLYGTTSGEGGDTQETAGTVDRITRDGAFTIVHHFVYGSNDGWDPHAQLVQNRDGALYGTTTISLDNPGTIFRINQAGDVTTLYRFCSSGDTCPDGGFPDGGLAQGADGAFYGATKIGGDPLCGLTSGCGTLFKLDRSGLTTLHVFENSDGAAPETALYQATDGNFYGTAFQGGNLEAEECFGVGCGTIFSLSPSGSFTLLYSFCATTGCPDGRAPFGPLTQGTDGNLYGTAAFSGTSDVGVIYKLSLGLPPFIKLLPASGVTGKSIRILGNNLLGTTGVTFNGVPAEFTVNTNSFITAKVPAGATSGTVQVTTPNGVLSSNIAFHVSR
ncbi:MAG: hypothetical protein H0X25_09495 [Acidobacteriales bacterium]|nr:hypothetical protein [Terriglobales bacterium]